MRRLPLISAALYILDVSLYPQTLEEKGDENILILGELCRGRGCPSFACEWGPSGPGISSNTACMPALHWGLPKLSVLDLKSTGLGAFWKVRFSHSWLCWKLAHQPFIYDLGSLSLSLSFFRGLSLCIKPLKMGQTSWFPFAGQVFNKHLINKW